MRGTIYYQTAYLAKAIFQSGAKKLSRINQNSSEFKRVASYQSMQSYRRVWNNLGMYIKDVYGIDDMEKIDEEHIINYIEEKIATGISHLYLKKISSAIGKLEFTLNLVSREFGKNVQYDFSIRHTIVINALKNELTANNYRDRAYTTPTSVITLLKDEHHKLAASIQEHGGTRAEGIICIKSSQLLGIRFDEIEKMEVGVIMTKEKGGKEGEVLLTIEDYNKLKTIIERDDVFRVNYNSYTKDIQNACRILGVKPEGTHGFRWCFAQRRYRAYTEQGYNHHQALQEVSYEMKHNRPDITSHYVGK